MATAPSSLLVPASNHFKLAVLRDTGFVTLRDYHGPRVPQEEWLSLEYMDWKSGGDTNFAPIASALGLMDCGGFWAHGKPDKRGIWTKNSEKCPTLVNWVSEVGAVFGRVRIIKLNRNTEREAIHNLHLDDNNRLNPPGEGWVARAWLELTHDPESYMILRRHKDDRSSEHRISLPRYRQIVLDSERVYHAVWHAGPAPRFALIASFETSPELERWIERELPAH